MTGGLIGSKITATFNASLTFAKNQFTKKYFCHDRHFEGWLGVFEKVLNEGTCVLNIPDIIENI